MKKYRILFFILAAALCCQPLISGAKENKVKSGKSNFSKSFQKKFGNRPIAVRQKLSNNSIGGYFPNSRTAEKSAERFYKILDYLPEDLIRKTKLKYVTFLRDLKLNGQYAGGVASGDTIYLPVDFTTKTVFHEFFHIFDPKSKDKKWCDLNEKKFIYTGSKFYKVEMNSKDKRQVKKNKRNNDIRDDFVSEYAMSFEHEDRAETFAYMIVEGKKFLKRTKNPVMKAKMEYIMALFIERKLLSQEFWDKHFDSKFRVKKRHYPTDKKENISSASQQNKEQ